MGEKRFAFGKNWSKYIQKSFSQERVDISKKHILHFLGVDSLKGQSFIDVGCGSGIHSLAAFQADANRIVSFDYDDDSVRTAQYLRREKAESATNWNIEQGSVLDEDYIRSLGKFDIVYSWGVLHHTGDQWTAIKNASLLVKEGGLLYIALYSADVQKDPPPQFWLRVKQEYNDASWWKKNQMVLWYIWNFGMGRKISRLPLIAKTMIEYKFSRGMNYLTDVRDWLGGWPMEFSHDDDVIRYLDEDLGFDLDKIKQGEANTEYLFRKREAVNLKEEPA